jgi:hypothetical protein
MKKRQSSIVEDIIGSRKNVIEIIVVAILLGSGVNIISGQIKGSGSFYVTSFGVLLILGSIFYLINHLFRSENRTYEAFFIYNKEENEILPVSRYDFAESLHDYLHAAITEDPAIKKHWDREPLGEGSESVKLVSEAIEYFVLSKLSTHLTDYFSDESFREKNLKVYGRKDIPDILFKNRFLELFSRPMRERVPFMDDSFDKLENGEIVCAYNPSGEIYEKFELVLPKESTVQRLGDYKVKIDTKKLKITITVRFEGYHASLPRGFEQYYLGIDNFSDIIGYVVGVDFQISIGFSALLTMTGWKYHGWIDSFLEEIENDVFKDAFLDRIGWESAFTLLQWLDLKQAKKEEMPEHLEEEVPLLDQAINPGSLTEYLYEKFPDRAHSDPRDIPQIVRDLSETGYKLLKDVDDMIEKSKNAFTQYERDLFKRDNYFNDVGVVRVSAEISDKKYRDFLYRCIREDLKKIGMEFGGETDFAKYEQLVKGEEEG